jgi:methylenetetrahydrofolate dehydrogenase (NADP+) / methenyltetrahydrofolate cyclohydrolase
LKKQDQSDCCQQEFLHGGRSSANVEDMLLLDGRKAKESYVEKLIERVKALPFSPCLVIIQVGDRADSDAFIKAKKSFAQKIGAKEIHVKFPESVSQKEIIETIEKYNKDATVQGIIVQLPLPQHLNPSDIINVIAPEKDPDGLTEKTKFIPATARGVRDLLHFYKISLKGKKVTVIGQSKLVGKPISKMCAEEGAVVTSCDSKTENISETAKDADILIVAIGKPKFITKEYVKEGAVVIDIGITRTKEGLVGDVDFDNINVIASAITPVPGGVGQMTVLALFENLVDAC